MSMTWQELASKMETTVEQLRSSLVGIRGSTVSPSLVSTVKVEYYGQPTPLEHVASVALSNGGISILPHDPSIVGLINKTLLAANFKSYVFSKSCVMVSVPPMSGDQRKEIIKHLQKLEEDAKVSVRNLRKKYRQTLTKEELKDEKPLQTLTDNAISEIEQIIEDRIQKL